MFDEDTDMVAVARNIARFFKHEILRSVHAVAARARAGCMQLLSRIEDGQREARRTWTWRWRSPRAWGAMPGTTICGLADGNNWALRTIMNKFPDEFESRVKPTYVPVKMTVGAGAR